MVSPGRASPGTLNAHQPHGRTMLCARERSAHPVVKLATWSDSTWKRTGRSPMQCRVRMSMDRTWGQEMAQATVSNGLVQWQGVAKPCPGSASHRHQRIRPRWHGRRRRPRNATARHGLQGMLARIDLLQPH